MYRFLILAYEKEIEVQETPMLDKATEIWLICNNSAEALKEAQTVFVAKHYHIRKIEKMYEIKTPGQAGPVLGPMTTLPGIQ